MKNGMYYTTDSPPELLDGEIFVCHKKIKKGSTFSAHRHNFIEIEMIVKGKATVGINGVKKEMGENCIYILRPTDIHTFSCEMPVQLLKINMLETVIARDILDIIMSCDDAFTDKLSRVQSGRMINLADILLNSVTHGNGYNDRLVCDIIDAMFSLLFTESGTDLLSLHKKSDNDPIKSAIIYMQLHFAENPALEKVARMVHYNPSYFSRLFHDRTNMTYTEYLNSLKINCAKQMLLESNNNITYIGEKCGFNSHSNFLRTFCSEVGCSPTAYRKNAK